MASSHDVGRQTFSSQNVKKNFVYFAIGKSLTMIVGFSLLLLLIRFLSIEEFTFYVIVLSLIEIVGLASSFGVLSIAQRYIPELMNSGHFSSMTRLVWVLAVARFFSLVFVCIFLFYFSAHLLSFINFSDYLTIFQLYLIVIVYENFNRYLDIVFESLLMQKVAQLTILVRNSLRLAAVVFFILFQEQFDLYVFVQIEISVALFGAGLGVIILIYKLKRLGRIQDTSYNRFLDYKRYFRFAAPTYYAQLTMMSYGPDLVKIITMKIFGSVETAAFGFAFSIMAMIRRFSPMFLLVGMIRPLIVTAYSKDDGYKHLNMMVHILLKINLLFALPVLAFVVLNGDGFISFLTGGKLNEAGMYLLFFTLLVILQTIHLIVNYVNMANEGGRINFLATIIGACGILIAFLALTFFEQFSFAIGLLISEIIWILIVLGQLIKCKVIFKQNIYGLLYLILAFTVATLVGAAFNEYQSCVFESWMELIISFTIIFVLFYGFLYKLKPFNDEERAMVKKVLPIPFFPF